jgi:hypothetical protein
MTGWTDSLANALLREFECVSDLGAPGALDRHKTSREAQRGLFHAIGKDGDISDILLAEKNFLAFELAHYANSKPMESSLTSAIKDLNIAAQLVETIHDPETYQMIDRGFSRDKNRLNGLPRDEARQFFRSHRTRLLNLDKGRLDRLDKQIIDARRANMRTAETTYIRMQQAALGITPDPSRPSRGRGAGRGM